MAADARPYTSHRHRSKLSRSSSVAACGMSSVALSVIGATEAMPGRDNRFALGRMHAAFRAAHERIGQLQHGAGSRRALRRARCPCRAACLRAGAGLGALELLEQPLAREEHKYQQEKLAHDLTNSRGNKSPGIQLSASNDRAMQQHFEHEAAAHISKQQRDE